MISADTNNNDVNGSILFSTKNDENLTFKRVITISHNDGKIIPNIYYDNETGSIIRKESDYKFLFRMTTIVIIILVFFILLDATVKYVNLRRIETKIEN